MMLTKLMRKNILIYLGDIKVLIKPYKQFTDRENGGTRINEKIREERDTLLQQFVLKQEISSRKKQNM